MSDSSDIDQPIGLRKKSKQIESGEDDKDNLSDYPSDNSLDSETRRANEEEEIR